MNHDYSALWADLEADGLRVNNLYQMDNKLWRCNLRRDHPGRGVLYEWGQGPDPYFAVIAAYSRVEARGVPPLEAPPPHATKEAVGFGKPKLSAAQMLRRLGL